MDETREISIDLRKTLYMMRSKIIYILIITVLAGALSGIYTHFFIAPVYTAHCSMCVFSNPSRTGDVTVSSGELNANATLVKTYMDVLKRQPVLNKVAEELGTPVTSKITTSQKGETQMFDINVSSSDPQLAADTANALCKVAPQEMQKIIKAGGVSIVDTAKVPTSPSSPDLKKNIMTGLLIGLAVSFAFFFVYELFDTSITNAKDLEREFDLPVLGTVPLLEPVEKAVDADSADSDDGELSPPEPSVSSPKPSASLLENLQTMKGEKGND